MQKLLVFYGSYRSDRAGIRFADYCVRKFADRGVQAELIDARAVGLPMLDRMYKEYPGDTAPEPMRLLAKKIAAADAFLFVAGVPRRMVVLSQMSLRPRGLLRE